MSHDTVYYSHPHTYGKGTCNWFVIRRLSCSIFSNYSLTVSVVNGEKKKSGLIRKYRFNMSRQAFREKAADMGWVKVREGV
jgi:small subunit ribosomal protein S29e